MESKLLVWCFDMFRGFANSGRMRAAFIENHWVWWMLQDQLWSLVRHWVSVGEVKAFPLTSESYPIIPALVHTVHTYQDSSFDPADPWVQRPGALSIEKKSCDEISQGWPWWALLRSIMQVPESAPEVGCAKMFKKVWGNRCGTPKAGICSTTPPFLYRFYGGFWIPPNGSKRGKRGVPCLSPGPQGHQHLHLHPGQLTCWFKGKSAGSPDFWCVKKWFPTARPLSNGLWGKV